jgi:K+-transporting ATPase ATPase A chain
MKLVMLFALASPLAILFPTAVAAVSQLGLAGPTTNTGAHGFSEILFAYTSCFANNGQSFGGLNSNLPFYNVTRLSR